MVNDNRYKAHVIKFNFWNPEFKKKKFEKKFLGKQKFHTRLHGNS
jgi:hypothetical protein